MAFKGIVLSCLILVIVSWLFSCYTLFNTTEKNEVENIWWGPDNLKEDLNVYDFRINLTQKDVDIIFLHLNISRGHTPPLQTSQQQYGISSFLLQNITNFLKKSYPIRDRVSYLNQYPQYLTNIQGLDIHFVRIKPKNITNTKFTPVILLHGWPSSVVEYYKMAPIIMETARNGSVFPELIIPSLPGFGYSSSPTKPGGSDTKNIAKIFDELMLRLGFEEYYVHGNDWGAVVATDMATLFPHRVKGLHSNFCVSLRRLTLFKIVMGSLVPDWVIPDSHVTKLYPLQDLLSFYAYETGYMHLQATKPDTIGVALDSSLEGWLAFAIEKLAVAADKNNIHLESGGIEEYDLTTLLDDLLFYYWIPKKALTSARLYKENLRPSSLFGYVNNLPIDPKVHCGCVFFENEFIYQPESFLKDKFTNLVHYKTFPFGGHFIALEKEASKLLAVDLAEFLVKVENKT